MGKKRAKKFNKLNIRNHFAEYFIFAIILVVVHLLMGLFQERILVNDGQGWDGEIYHSMAVQALNDEPFSQRSPFVYRQLLPYLAAKFVSVANNSGDAQQEIATQITSIFSNINLLAATLTAFLILILIFLRGFIADARLRICVAALNRGTAILIPIAALFLLPVSTHPSYIAKIISYVRNFKFILLLPFAGVIAAFLLVRHNVEVTGSYGDEIAKYKAGYLVFVVD